MRDRILRDFPGYGRTELARRQVEALAAGDFAAADGLQERLDALPSGEPDGPEEAMLRVGLLYESGKGLLEEGRAEEAQALFERLLDDDPAFVPAALRLGRGCRGAG